MELGDDDELLFTVTYFLADRRHPIRPKSFTTPLVIWENGL